MQILVEYHIKICITILSVTRRRPLVITQQTNKQTRIGQIQKWFQKHLVEQFISTNLKDSSRFDSNATRQGERKKGIRMSVDDNIKFNSWIS